LPDEAPSFDWSGDYDDDIHVAYRMVARHVYQHGRLGEFAYRAFDYINANFFEGKLPETLILWDLTEWGGCLGKTRSANDGPPIVKLHPALVLPAAEHPWGYSPDVLGRPFAYHVLLHECVHVAVNYLYGGYEGLPGCRSYWTSHNNPLWVGEINRLAPLIGYEGDPFTMRLPRRVPAGGVGKSGKPLTRSVRCQEGNAPNIEHFPHNLPGMTSFYRNGELPFPWTQERCSCPST
jgi:hypothetical protein